MSQYQDDDFSKAYTTALYQTKGEVQTNIRVKSEESLEIDLLFSFPTFKGPSPGCWRRVVVRRLYDRLGPL